MNNGDLAIRARGLTKRFGAVTAVDGLDLTVRRREVYGFLGPNGSGKSTTIRMLCGLMNPTAGEIDVLGYSIPRDAEALKRRIGYMTQKFSAYEDLTVDENLAFLAAVHDIPRRGFQGDHYDIPEEYRQLLIDGGAEVVPSRELLRRLRDAGLRMTPAQRRAFTNGVAHPADHAGT